MYKVLCGHVVSFVLNTYLGLELLGQMASLCVTFGGIGKMSSVAAALFGIPTSNE